MHPYNDFQPYNNRCIRWDGLQDSESSGFEQSRAFAACMGAEDFVGRSCSYAQTNCPTFTSDLGPRATAFAMAADLFVSHSRPSLRISSPLSSESSAQVSAAPAGHLEKPLPTSQNSPGYYAPAGKPCSYWCFYHPSFI